jgi:predicted AAA+ superfamily ATPase
LLNAISESLAGRVAIVELAPFSLAESFAKPQPEIYRIITNAEPMEQLLQLTPQ